jgi:ABC-type ATPase with predicted acetyltransferase domain
MKVKSVKFEDSLKVFKLENGRRFRTRRYCCLGPGDDLVLRRSGAVARCMNGEATILPLYKRRAKLVFGGREIKLFVKELESQDELEGYHRLEEYHYRGTVLHGRRVPLVVCSRDPLLPRVLGYIELSTAFMMNKPRSAVFDSKFDGGDGISWARWDKKAVRSFTNVVVRIARCVVSPEFRGLGIARVLVEHAIRFARTHWHIAKLKPLFLEITADMLRYVPFVEPAGMHYVGDTEGNLARVNKDMNYILKNFRRVKRREILKEESAGIVDLQVFYATRLKQIEDSNGVSRDKLLKLLVRAPHRLSDEHWSLLHRIYRSPKPTFLVGLTARAEKFIRQRLLALKIPPKYPVRQPRAYSQKTKHVLSVSSCGYQLESKLMRTRATRRIQEAFGINNEMMRTTLFSNLSFKAAPGQIVLLCGPSGAGKSTLLRVLCNALAGRIGSKQFQGKVECSPRLGVAVLRELSNKQPLISALGPKRLVDDALHALNLSGLAEAHLYVKRFRDLSNGQRYRAMIARLIASGAGVWLADEFCATLDPITANIVARNLRRCVNEFQVRVVVAAANWSEFIDELKPDVVVHLRSPWESCVFNGEAFRKAVEESNLILTSSSSLKSRTN